MNSVTKDTIMAFFDENTEFDYTVSDIAKAISMNAHLLKSVIAELVGEGKLVVVRTRKRNINYATNYVNSYQKKNWLNTKRKKELERFNNHDPNSEKRPIGRGRPCQTVDA